MTRRVVVYAEGSADRAGELSLLPAPGEQLAEEHLGPAQILVRRVLETGGFPEGAVRFEAPLRVRSGREATGSDLHHGRTLRRLLSWPRSDLRPELVVVLVDADDEATRAQRLEQETKGMGVVPVVVAAAREFEAWLIADTGALRKTLDLDIQPTREPESMTRGEAKQLLAEWIARCLHVRPDGGTSHAKRRELAHTCDLNEVARRCPSFADLLRRLGRPAK